MTSVGATAGCAFLDLVEPFQCSLLEGPLQAIAAVCGTDIIDRVCEYKCPEKFQALDAVKMALTINQSVNRTIDHMKQTLDRASLTLSQRSVDTSRIVANATNRMTQVPALMGRYNRILSRIKFLSFLFSRINLDKNGDLEDDRVRHHYLNTAKESPHNQGVLTLMLGFHNILVGRGISIYGHRQPSLFQMDHRYCHHDSVQQIKVTVLTLAHQMNYIHNLETPNPRPRSRSSNSHCNDLTTWTSELQDELDLQLRQDCDQELHQSATSLIHQQH